MTRTLPTRLLVLLVALLRNGKARSILLQIALAFAIVAGLCWVAANTERNLGARGIATGFGFLTRSARFPISQSVLPYSPTDTFAWAFLVGLVNTLFLSVSISAGATLLGLAVALARRSRHSLLSALAAGFIEAGRNTPLVVQLLFWYALLTVGLPQPHSAWHPLPHVFVTNRGMYLPALTWSGDPKLFLTVAALALICISAAVMLSKRICVPREGRRTVRLVTAAAAVVAACVAWGVSGLHIGYEVPQLGRFNFSGGLSLTPELAAILAGLVLYSACYISETIRGGLDAVPVGQWESGRALGLTERQTLRFVIVPQALRMIIPPLSSQYINVAKNTTLALVVGYPDLAFVTATTINQTGQAVEGVLILMLAFLVISLGAALLMSRFQRRAMLERP